MSKIVYEFQVGKYRVFKVEPFAESPYGKIKVGGKLFEPIPTYDMPDCVSIEYTGEHSFLNSGVEFV